MSQDSLVKIFLKEIEKENDFWRVVDSDEKIF